MFGGDDGFAIRVGRAHPPVAIRILRQLFQPVTHQHLIALVFDVALGGIPHHAGAEARIAEGLEQGFDFLSVIGLLVEAERAFQAIGHRVPQAQALDPLRRPVRGHFVARHAPDLLGIGLEEDRIELVAELVDRPVLEAPHILVRKDLRLAIAQHAQGRAPDAEIPQGFKSAKWIAVEFAFIIDAAHPGPLDEVVGQNLVPQIDHLLALRKEAMPANIKTETFMLHRPADPADILRILLDHGDRIALFGKQIGGGETRGSGPDNGDIYDILGGVAWRVHQSGPRPWSAPYGRGSCFRNRSERNWLADS